MEYRLGNFRKIKSSGETVELTCPKCNKKVNMSLYSNGEIKLKAELPFVSTGSVYFLICPSCAGIFGVDESRAKTFDKGDKLAIGNFDLKELDKFEV